MRRTGLIIVIVGVCGLAACQLLLGEGFVIKGPILNSILGRGVDAPSESLIRSRLTVPAGFQVGLFAVDLPNVRFMRFSPDGALIASQPRDGRLVHVLPDRDGDGRSDGRRTLVEGLDRPHGFDFRDGAIYVGEGSAIARVPLSAGPDGPVATGAPERIVEGIPEGGNHWTRTLRFGPDDGLYLSVGSSCNVCEEEDPRRAAILRFEPDGTGEEIFAAGLRNAVGFDWQPGSGDLYATDNGRDLLGDDYPPCELNLVIRGGFYGWPYANGDKRPDPDLGAGNEDQIDRSIPPVHGFRAHNAPLGMTFLRHAAAGPQYRGAALAALHGSWNRSTLDGYRVVSLHWDASGEITERDFLTGFEEEGDVIGRPVDVVEGPDGAIYVSDDYAGAIFRITRGGAASEAAASQAVPPAAPRAVDDPLAAYDEATRANLIARGETLFAERACAGCHVEGQGEEGVVVKPLQRLAPRYTVDSLTAFFLAPTPPMPVFDLPEEDRRALAVLLLARHP